MKLHWSPTSPYVRKVMIFAHETGLDGSIEKFRPEASRFRANPEIIKDSPVGKIPVLVLEDGLTLTGSFAICEYLDSLHDGRKLIPVPGKSRWRELELHGIADGMLDLLVCWRGEFLKPAEQRSKALCESCETRIRHSLAWLEARAKSFGSEEYGIGQITSGIVLDYLDFRFARIDWRTANPDLRKWREVFAHRPSSRATAPGN